MNIHPLAVGTIRVTVAVDDIELTSIRVCCGYMASIVEVPNVPPLMKALVKWIDKHAKGEPQC